MFIDCKPPLAIRADLQRHYNGTSTTASALPDDLLAMKGQTNSTQQCKYACPFAGCETFHAMQADLQRHYEDKHTPVGQLKTWSCDCKDYSRSHQGGDPRKHLAGGDPRKHLADGDPHTHLVHLRRVLGTSILLVGPFTRKDHFKAHRRDRHQEPIPKRDGRLDLGWLDGSTLKEEWWRCGSGLIAGY